METYTTRFAFFVLSARPYLSNCVSLLGRRTKITVRPELVEGHSNKPSIQHSPSVLRYLSTNGGCLNAVSIKRRIPLAVSAIVALNASSFDAFAQVNTSASADTRADNIVVTATRTERDAFNTLAQTAVITRAEIENAGLISLAELLQRRAGVEIRATGGPGQPSSVFIRGANATHTVVLVDGLRLGSSTSGSAAFENIPLDLIDRIEVVKGPRSGLYGADAIGGVIQIFTRKGRGTSGMGTIGAGNIGARNANAQLNVGADATQFTLMAGTQKIDAPSATNPFAGSFTFNPDRDPYENTNAKIGLSHQFTKTDRIALDIWQSRGKTDFDSGSGTFRARNDQRLSGLGLKLDNQFAEAWRSRVQVGETTDDIRIQSAFPGTFKTRQQQLGWQNDFTVGQGDVTLGLERRDEKLASTTNYTTKSRKTDAVFIAANQRVDDFTINANVRRDREDQFGSRTTGGASLGLNINAQQLLYVSAATAFRAPSFNDLYFPGFSNPLLQPEKSRSQEIGWRWRDANLRVNVAAFDNRINNLIAFDFVTSRPQNVQRARIRGLEASVEATLLGVNWRVDVTSQTPKNADTGKRLRSRAETFGALSASQTIGAWSWSANVTASGARFDSASESATSRMGGYALLGANVRYAVTREWSLEIIGSNLTDRTYELARGYNQLPRQVMLNVRWTGQ
jgi:vitamin B12 transporter